MHFCDVVFFLLLESLQGYFHPLCDHKWLQKHFQTRREAFRTMAHTSARFYGSFLLKCKNKILTIRIVTGYFRIVTTSENYVTIRIVTGYYPDSQNFNFTFDQEMKKSDYWMFWCFVKVNSVKKLSILFPFPFCDQNSKWNFYYPDNIRILSGHYPDIQYSWEMVAIRIVSG